MQWLRRSIYLYKQSVTLEVRTIYVDETNTVRHPILTLCFSLQNRLKTPSSNQRPQPFRIPCTELKHEVENYGSRETPSVILKCLSRGELRYHYIELILWSKPQINVCMAPSGHLDSDRRHLDSDSPKVIPFGGFDLLSLPHHGIDVHSC